MSSSNARLRIGLLALDGSVLSSLTGPMDVVRIAQKLAEVRDPGTKLRMDTVLVGARGQSVAVGSGGLSIGPVQSPDVAMDVLVMPGFMHSSAEDMVD